MGLIASSEWSVVIQNCIVINTLSFISNHLILQDLQLIMISISELDYCELCDYNNTKSYLYMFVV